MGFKFIAVNGDNVGDSIGNAIATDNHDELSNITGKLKEAHGSIDEWVQSVGGEVITSSGDEGIYKVPSESFDETAIESLRSEYSLSTGSTITIGIGDSMSEASKALIYGKLNEKDQVVEYDPHIDDYIAGHGEEVEDESDKGDNQGAENQMGEGEEMPTPDQDAEDDGYTDQEAVGDEEYEDESAADLIGGQQVDNPEYQKEVPEMEETAVNGESVNEETDEQLPDDMYAEDDEDDETLAEEGEMSEDDLNVNPEDKLDNVVSEDLDGDGDIDTMQAQDETIPTKDGVEVDVDQDGDGDIDAASADLDGDGDIDGEYIEDGTEEQLDNQSALTDMIHANMGGEEQGEEDDGSDEELRQDIANSLMTFKENKPMLEQAKVENPKLYEATILMLRSMIEMAKKLNMNPEADVNGQEAQDALPDAEMAQMEEGEEQPPMPEQEGAAEAEDAENLEEVEDDAEDDNNQEKKDKNPFGKSEQIAKDLANIFSDKLKKALGKAEKAPAKKKALRKAPKKGKKGLPKETTKHITRKQLPLGAVKNGKVRVKDGTTGKISWRSGRKGMKRDLDGDAIVGKKDRKAKRSNSHTVHQGRRSKKDIHHPGETSWKE